MLPFREQPKYGVDVGWPGPPNEKASLAWSKYIVVDTFAKAVQSRRCQGGDRVGRRAAQADVRRLARLMI